MTVEQILEEIEKLDEATRRQVYFHCAMQLSDLRLLHLKHPDEEMVRSSCLHFLGDAAQKWYSEWKAQQANTVSVWDQMLDKLGPLELSDFDK